MVRERWFDTGQVRLNYAEGAMAGPPLVLLHGGNARWQSFLPIIPALADAWHVYALDLRGYGGSGRVPAGYTLEAWAGDVAAFVRSEVGQPAVVLAHSLGAVIALHLAVIAPEWTRALALIDPPIYLLSAERFEAAGLPRFFAAWRSLIKANASAESMLPALAGLHSNEPPGELRFLAESLARIDPEVYTMGLDGRALGDYRPDALLPRVGAPVLVVQGNPALGGNLTDAEAARMRALLPNCTLVRMEDAGHQIHRSHPVALAQAVRVFLSEFPAEE